MDNAQALVAMGTMFSPELAALNLQPDGNPVALELPQLQSMGIDAFAALSEGAIAVSIGEEAESEAAEMLGAESPTPLPFMSFSMDAKRYYEFVGDAVMQQEESEESEPMPPEMRNAIRDIMVSSGDIYERMSVNVHLTERGVEVNTRMTLAD